MYDTKYYGKQNPNNFKQMEDLVMILSNIPIKHKGVYGICSNCVKWCGRDLLEKPGKCLYCNIIDQMHFEPSEQINETIKLVDKTESTYTLTFHYKIMIFTCYVNRKNSKVTLIQVK